VGALRRGKGMVIDASARGLFGRSPRTAAAGCLEGCIAVLQSSCHHSGSKPSTLHIPAAR
jgi:hypothetical protein